MLPMTSHESMQITKLYGWREDNLVLDTTNVSRKCNNGALRYEIIEAMMEEVVSSMLNPPNSPQ